MDLAAVCETAALLCENEVCNKVADVVAAADGDDNFLSSVVYGSIAGNACSPATIERLLDVYFRNMFFFGGRGFKSYLKVSMIVAPLRCMSLHSPEHATESPGYGPSALQYAAAACCA